MVNNYFEKIGENRIIFIKTNKELLSIMNECYKKNIGIRVIGSGWNFNNTTISNNKNGITIKLTGDFDKFYLDKDILVSGGGMMIHKLLKYLDKTNLQLNACGGCMEPSESQTVGGLLATNVSGSGNVSFFDVVELIKLATFVNGKSKIVQVKKNTDLFNAAIGGIGVVGIIIEVNFKLVEKKFYKKVKRQLVSKNELISNIQNYNSKKNNELTAYAHFRVNNISPLNRIFNNKFFILIIIYLINLLPNNRFKTYKIISFIGLVLHIIYKYYFEGKYIKDTYYLTKKDINDFVVDFNTTNYNELELLIRKIWTKVDLYTESIPYIDSIINMFFRFILLINEEFKYDVYSLFKPTVYTLSQACVRIWGTTTKDIESEVYIRKKDFYIINDFLNNNKYYLPKIGIRITYECKSVIAANSIFEDNKDGIVVKITFLEYNLTLKNQFRTFIDNLYLLLKNKIIIRFHLGKYYPKEYDIKLSYSVNKINILKKLIKYHDNKKLFRPKNSPLGIY